MQTVNIHHAKTHLSKLIAGAVAGKPFVIAKAGKPLVKVEAVAQAEGPKKRPIGMLDGQYTIPDDWKAFAREEIEEMFFGERDA